MKSTFVIVLLVGVFARNAFSYPDQVPATDLVCKTMVPGHGPKPQASKSPYGLQISTTSVKSGERVEVVLKGDSDFKGFYLQARSADGTPIGTFFPPNAQVKVHSCGSGKDNAIFHGSRGSRNNVAVSWQPPTDFKGDVNFVVTFVHDFDKFWTDAAPGSKVSVA